MKDLPGLHRKRPAPGQKSRLTLMIDGIRAAGAVSYRTFATPRGVGTAAGRWFC
jgi:hypothetical protein